jgi:hypothetical protein
MEWKGESSVMLHWHMGILRVFRMVCLPGLRCV